MTAFIAYDHRYPVNLDLVRYIELDEDITGNPGICFYYEDDSWVRWEFDTAEERAYVFKWLPIQKITPKYIPPTPEKPA
jgi:hypothetical protein